MVSFGQNNIAIYQGDDWAGEVTVLNADGTPVNLTNYTPEAQIRTGPADEARHVVAELTCVIEPAVAPAVPNVISISLTNAQTRRMRQTNYHWDLQITSSTGEVTTLLAGRVSVTKEVTRPWLYVMPVDELAEEVMADVEAEEYLR